MRVIAFQVKETDIEQYALISGDVNPIHMDIEAAKRYGYSNRIGHGMLTMAKIWSAAAQELKLSGPKPSLIRMKFLAPVYAGDEVQLTLSRESDILHIKGTSRGETVVKGSITLRTP
ncbi:MaoC family dehydratase [Metabacillus sp. RGM 3146]|uniref:MaoC family dehydratase n=1 Tax=Metabacillus sp. RGM 3146 TaxID=3401092 RepID=UPI003B99A6FB